MLKPSTCYFHPSFLSNHFGFLYCLSSFFVRVLSSVRGESFLLKSKIEHDMPNISVDIIPGHSNNAGQDAVLQGQLSNWILRISNLGPAPATNLTLKTNAPWINICSKDLHNRTDRESEYKATSHCVGPSGTLMNLPLPHRKSNNQSKSKFRGAIHPGQTIEIPVQVRTSGGGKQEFYMLFRYELLEEDDNTFISSTSSKCRWLRKMMSVAVHPSLTVTASLKPSYWKKREHILSIEVNSSESILNVLAIIIFCSFHRKHESQR